MRDPHVISLKYVVKTDGSVIVRGAPPLTFQVKEFEGCLDRDELVVNMIEHYPSEEEARFVVDPYLRSWEMNMLLDRFPLAFEFVRSDVIDRNPPPAGEHRIVEARAHASSTASASATAALIKGTYPAPPAHFNRSPLVVAMADRLQQYLNGGESLFSAAYYCVTALERSAAQAGEGTPRRNAAIRYRVDYDVLKQLGALSSERGGPLEARKFGAAMPTGQETQWLETTIRRLIRHIAAVEGGDMHAQLTMSDLPPLTP